MSTVDPASAVKTIISEADPFVTADEEYGCEEYDSEQVNKVVTAETGPLAISLSPELINHS